MSKFKYKAFISYSHEDEATARWLHRALETYRPPRGVLRSSHAAHSSKYPLRPIFRDQDELVASANLSDSLVEALQQSEFLIVICSHNSVKSRWTSQEIVEFKKLHGSQNVIAVIADGDPNNSFPEPLLHAVQPSGELDGEPVEPLAADLQGGRTRRRLAMLKIAATLLGTDLDELVQREAQRRYRVLATLATAALAGMLVMGWLTYTAVTERRAADSARSAAEQARQMAEQRREQAEGLIEFMLTDLRDKLQPVGRLDVLSAVGEKSLNYYSKQEQLSLGADSLGRRARALHLLGEISNLEGDLDAALSRFSLAAESTEALMRAHPGDPQRIFDHAQSVFWVGYVDLQRARYPQAQIAFDQYLDLAEQLVAIDSANPDWQLELYYAHNNLGGLAIEAQAFHQAEPHLLKARDLLQLMDEQGNGSHEEWANIYSWLTLVYEQLKQFERARDYSRKEIDSFQELVSAHSNDYWINVQLLIAHRGRARLELYRGNAELSRSILEPLQIEIDRLIAFEPRNSHALEQKALLNQDLAELSFLRADMSSALRYSAVCREQAGRLQQRDDSVLFWKVEMDWRCRFYEAEIALESGEGGKAEAHISSYYPDLLTAYESQPDQKEIAWLLGQSSVLLGDIAVADGRNQAAQEYWHRAETVLAGETTRLDAPRVATLADVLHRQGKTAEAEALVSYLREVDYRHPGFVHRWED